MSCKLKNIPGIVIKCTDKRYFSYKASHYIVTFKSDTPEHVIEQEAKKVEESGATIKHRYNAAIKGFSVEVPDSQINALSLTSEHINHIEADGVVTTQGQSLLKGSN